jgi:hypothetical protein
MGSFAGVRRIMWSAAASDRPAVLDILAHDDRVVAVREPGIDDAQLVDVLDRSGQRLRTIAGRRGAWSIDPRGPMLLGTSSDAYPSAWALGDLSSEPILWTTRFEDRELCDLRMLDDLLLATALEPRRLGGPPPSVLVALIRIADYDDASRWRTLRSTTRVAERIAGDTSHVVVGIEPAGPILVTDGHVYWADWSLQTRAVLELAGHPLVSSPRSDGRTWMLAVHYGEPQLRLLSPGRCELLLPVHAAFHDAERLLVTADDGAIIVSRSRIQSFDAQGNFRWKYARDGAPRALVDADGTAIFTHAGGVIAADPAGHCREVWTAPPPISQLGPLSTIDDQLIVAAGPDLFALAK